MKPDIPSDNNAWAFSIAEDSDISARQFDQVLQGKLWRGWVGTIYGCMVGTEKGMLANHRLDAIENARMMREQCRAIHRSENPKLGKKS